MTDYIIIIGIGVALLVMILAAGHRRSAEGFGPGGDAPNESEYLVRLPPCALLARCLSVEDVEFAATLRSPAVMRLLLDERRHLALEWLRQTRREAGRLFRLHVRSVRYAADLRPGAEFALLFQAGVFLLLYQVLVAAVKLYGPVRARGFVRSVHGLAELLSNLGGRIAESIAPGRVSELAGAAPSGRA